MRVVRTFGIAAAVVAVLLAARFLWGAVRGIPAASAQSPGGVVALGLVAGLVVLMGVLVVGVALALFDVGPRREEEARRLETVISSALRRDVGHLPVTLAARVPTSGGSPVVLEVTGAVSTSAQRDAVIDVVERELGRRRSFYRVDDRLEVSAAAVSAA